LLIFLRGSFHGLFFVLCRSSRSVALLTKSPRSKGGQRESLQRAPRPAPCGVGLKKGDRKRPG
jgi:hypothetical protein